MSRQQGPPNRRPSGPPQVSRGADNSDQNNRQTADRPAWGRGPAVQENSWAARLRHASQSAGQQQNSSSGPGQSSSSNHASASDSNQKGPSNLLSLGSIPQKGIAGSVQRPSPSTLQSLGTRPQKATTGGSQASDNASQPTLGSSPPLELPAAASISQASQNGDVSTLPGTFAASADLTNSAGQAAAQQHHAPGGPSLVHNHGEPIPPSATAAVAGGSTLPASPNSASAANIVMQSSTAAAISSSQEVAGLVNSLEHVVPAMNALGSDAPCSSSSNPGILLVAAGVPSEADHGADGGGLVVEDDRLGTAGAAGSGNLSASVQQRSASARLHNYTSRAAHPLQSRATSATAAVDGAASSSAAQYSTEPSPVGTSLRVSTGPVPSATSQPSGPAGRLSASAQPAAVTPSASSTVSDTSDTQPRGTNQAAPSVQRSPVPAWGRGARSFAVVLAGANAAVASPPAPGQPGAATGSAPAAQAEDAPTSSRSQQLGVRQQRQPSTSGPPAPPSTPQPASRPLHSHSRSHGPSSAGSSGSAGPSALATRTIPAFFAPSTPVTPPATPPRDPGRPGAWPGGDLRSPGHDDQVSSSTSSSSASPSHSSTWRTPLTPGTPTASAPTPSTSQPRPQRQLHLNIQPARSLQLEHAHHPTAGMAVPAPAAAGPAAEAGHPGLQIAGQAGAPAAGLPVGPRPGSPLQPASPQLHEPPPIQPAAVASSSQAAPHPAPDPLRHARPSSSAQGHGAAPHLNPASPHPHTPPPMSPVTAPLPTPGSPACSPTVRTPSPPPSPPAAPTPNHPSSSSTQQPSLSQPALAQAPMSWAERVRRNQAALPAGGGNPVGSVGAAHPANPPTRQRRPSNSSVASDSMSVGSLDRQQANVTDPWAGRGGAGAGVGHHPRGTAGTPSTSGGYNAPRGTRQGQDASSSSHSAHTLNTRGRGAGRGGPGLSQRRPSSDSVSSEASRTSAASSSAGRGWGPPASNPNNNAWHRPTHPAPNSASAASRQPAASHSQPVRSHPPASQPDPEPASSSHAAPATTQEQLPVSGTAARTAAGVVAGAGGEPPFGPGGPAWGRQPSGPAGNRASGPTGPYPSGPSRPSGPPGSSPPGPYPSRPSGPSRPTGPHQSGPAGPGGPQPSGPPSRRPSGPTGPHPSGLQGPSEPHSSGPAGPAGPDPAARQPAGAWGVRPSGPAVPQAAAAHGPSSSPHGSPSSTPSTPTRIATPAPTSPTRAFQRSNSLTNGPDMGTDAGPSDGRERDTDQYGKNASPSRPAAGRAAALTGDGPRSAPADEMAADRLVPAGPAGTDWVPGALGSSHGDAHSEEPSSSATAPATGTAAVAPAQDSAGAGAATTVVTTSAATVVQVVPGSVAAAPAGSSATVAASSITTSAGPAIGATLPTLAATAPIFVPAATAAAAAAAAGTPAQPVTPTLAGSAGLASTASRHSTIGPAGPAPERPSTPDSELAQGSSTVTAAAAAVATVALDAETRTKLLDLLQQLCVAQSLRQVLPGARAYRLSPRGLVNTGNSCFMNATLQALLATSAFCGILHALLQVRPVLDKAQYPTLAAMAELAAELHPSAAETPTTGGANGVAEGKDNKDSGWKEVPKNRKGKSQVHPAAPASHSAPLPMSQMLGGKPLVPAMMSALVSRFQPQPENTTGGSVAAGPQQQTQPLPANGTVTLAQKLNMMKAPAAADQEQQDAQEFLQFLLDHAHEELLQMSRQRASGGDSSSSWGAAQHSQHDEVQENGNEVAGEQDEWETVGRRNKSAVTRKHELPYSLISGVFRGKLRSTVKAAGEKASVTEEPFMLLHLFIAEGVRTLEEALSHFTAPETIHGYKTKGGQQVDAVKVVKIAEAPTVLVLHLLRFTWQQGNVKNMRHLGFGHQLRLTPAMLADECPQQRTGVEYKLVATVTHRGRDTWHGHYTAHALQQNGTWLHFNDANVTKATDGHVLGESTYMLVYERGVV